MTAVAFDFSGVGQVIAVPRIISFLVRWFSLAGPQVCAGPMVVGIAC